MKKRTLTQNEEQKVAEIVEAKDVQEYQIVNSRISGLLLQGFNSAGKLVKVKI